MKYICMIFMFQVLVLTMACSNRTSENVNNENSAFVKVNEDGTPALINFRSFQNADKTWGFTIIINNVPFRNYNKIPYKNAQSGFTTQQDAEDVALLFVKMIKRGVQSPALTSNMIDSLGIKMNKNM